MWKLKHYFRTNEAAKKKHKHMPWGALIAVKTNKQCEDQ
jgi:hypothetical protein